MRVSATRRGRIDIHAEASSGEVAVVEVKATDWDRMDDTAVRRNACRHARQVWRYIEAEVALEKNVCPGIVYERTPRDPARRDLIESLLEERGIAVVWVDETTAARRARSR